MATSKPTVSQVGLKGFRTGKPTNLYLNKQLVADARKKARERYRLSVSELIEKLLELEVQSKTGVLAT